MAVSYTQNSHRKSLGTETAHQLTVDLQNQKQHPKRKVPTKSISGSLFLDNLSHIVQLSGFAVQTAYLQACVSAEGLLSTILIQVLDCVGWVPICKQTKIFVADFLAFRCPSTAISRIGSINGVFAGRRVNLSDAVPQVLTQLFDCVSWVQFVSRPRSVQQVFPGFHVHQVLVPQFSIQIWGPVKQFGLKVCGKVCALVSVVLSSTC